MRMSDELFLKRAAEEDGCMISAIGLRLQEKKSEPLQPAEELVRFAFGTLISYRRRALRMNMEDVAQKADVELDELLRIEENSSYVPEPETVQRLADLLELPTPQLLILSGNTTAVNMELTEAAVRFAARSRAVEKLKPEQTAALNEFVKVLVDQKLRATKKKQVRMG